MKLEEPGPQPPPFVLPELVFEGIDLSVEEPAETPQEDRAAGKQTEARSDSRSRRKSDSERSRQGETPQKDSPPKAGAPPKPAASKAKSSGSKQVATTDKPSEGDAFGTGLATSEAQTGKSGEATDTKAGEIEGGSDPQSTPDASDAASESGEPQKKRPKRRRRRSRRGPKKSGGAADSKSDS